MKEIKDITPITLIKVLGFSEKEKWYTWEPETLRLEFQLADENSYDTLIALASLVSQYYHEQNTWERSDIFSATAVSLFGYIPNTVYWDKLRLSQVLYMAHVCNEIDSKELFSDEINIYIASCLLDRSILHCPPLYYNITGHIDEWIMKFAGDFEFSKKDQHRIHQLIIGKIQYKTKHADKILAQPGDDKIKIQIARIMAEYQEFQIRLRKSEKELQLLKK